MFVDTIPYDCFLLLICYEFRAFAFVLPGRALHENEIVRPFWIDASDVTAILDALYLVLHSLPDGFESECQDCRIAHIVPSEDRTYVTSLATLVPSNDANSIILDP